MLDSDKCAGEIQAEQMLGSVYVKKRFEILYKMAKFIS